MKRFFDQIFRPFEESICGCTLDIDTIDTAKGGKRMQVVRVPTRGMQRLITQRFEESDQLRPGVRLHNQVEVACRTGDAVSVQRKGSREGIPTPSITQKPTHRVEHPAKVQAEWPFLCPGGAEPLQNKIKGVGCQHAAENRIAS